MFCENGLPMRDVRFLFGSGQAAFFTPIAAALLEISHNFHLFFYVIKVFCAKCWKQEIKIKKFFQTP